MQRFLLVFLSFGATFAPQQHFFNAAEGGRTPPLPLERVAELGFSLVIYPIATLLAATAAVQSVLGAIRRDGTPHAVDLPGFDAFTATVGLPEIGELETRFGV